MYNLIENGKEIEVNTNFGKPSDKLIKGLFGGVEVVFLARHSRKHTIMPHQINYRANIDAFKQLGIKIILAPSAVGSLKENIKPGEFVIVDQFIDRTHGRKNTFYDDGKRVCHVSVAKPCCSETRKLIIDVAKQLGLNHHEKGTSVCINGPRFSTKAESELFRSWNADIIGMTLVPECVLAREAEICYVSIAIITDYDCWKDTVVSIEDVLKTVKANEERLKKLLTTVLSKIDVKRDCSCHHALDNAFI